MEYISIFTSALAIAAIIFIGSSWISFAIYIISAIITSIWIWITAVKKKS